MTYNSPDKFKGPTLGNLGFSNQWTPQMRRETHTCCASRSSLGMSPRERCQLASELCTSARHKVVVAISSLLSYEFARRLLVPVSYFPVFMALLLTVGPVAMLLKGPLAFFSSLAASVAFLAVLFGWVYITGSLLQIGAMRGDARSQYEYARWVACHRDSICDIIAVPISAPNQLESFAWLERAAAQQYPPALWLTGVRLKYGLFVPVPPHWNGPGDLFPQPKRGQVLIDRAKEFGYMPPTGDEEQYCYFDRVP